MDLFVTYTVGSDVPVESVLDNSNSNNLQIGLHFLGDLLNHYAGTFYYFLAPSLLVICKECVKAAE